MTRQEIRRAARVLRREAAIYRASATHDGRWCDADDDSQECHDRHDEMLDLARKLEALAKSASPAARAKGEA